MLAGKWQAYLPDKCQGLVDPYKLILNMTFVLFPGAISAKFSGLTPIGLFKSTGIFILYDIVLSVNFLSSFTIKVLKFQSFATDPNCELVAR